MAERLRRVRVVRAPNVDLGVKLVTIVDILEGGRPTGHYVTFEHGGKTESTSVTKIEPPDWEMQPEIIPILTI